MTDLNALNRDFKKYDQVRKAHTYRLAEQSGDEFDDEYRIATLDFSWFRKGDAAEKAVFAQEFARALEEIGFAVLTGHGEPWTGGAEGAARLARAAGVA